MVKVANEELSKIAQFIASCDDMINGKFILADVKITKVLNMIAGSDELYRYISECMVGFDFSREYHRAEVKNGLNGGRFQIPAEPDKLVAFVFCVLVECDAKRLDFYNFINDNFGKENKTDAYKNFAQTLLVPFKEIIADKFGLGGVSNQALSEMTEQYREDLKEEPIFEDDNNNNTFVEEQIKQNYMMEEEFNKTQLQKEEEKREKDIWDSICEICENVESSVYAERHLKDYLREELLYILKTIRYSTKYKDVKIISALITAFDELTKKYRSIQFVFGELKSKMQSLYE